MVEFDTCLPGERNYNGVRVFNGLICLNRIPQKLS